MPTVGISNPPRWTRRTYFDVLDELEGHRHNTDILLVGIDGISGAGKSSLARGLAALDSHAAVLHTDDVAWHHSFFDWQDVLIDQLLRPMRAGPLPVRLRPAAWVERGRHGAIVVPRDTTTVFLEGVGACRRELRPYLDVLVWMHVRPEVGLRRVAARAADSPEFIAEWNLAEELFLGEHQPWACADLLVAGELGQPAADGRSGHVVTAPGPGSARSAHH